MTENIRIHLNFTTVTTSFERCHTGPFTKLMWEWIVPHSSLAFFLLSLRSVAYNSLWRDESETMGLCDFTLDDSSEVKAWWQFYGRTGGRLNTLCCNRKKTPTTSVFITHPPQRHSWIQSASARGCRHHARQGQVCRVCVTRWTMFGMRRLS